MSEDTRSRRILDAFDAALDVPADERDAWLEAHFAGDAGLIAAVKALIAADAVAPASMPTELPDGGGETLVVAPKRVGPFVLEDKIGAGGMGDVWLGRRDDGLFEQEVAVKLMRPSRFSPEALAFFDTERQALARLRHANIARLYDGGVTPEGLPWFIMDRIDGVPLDRWLAVAQPERKARLRLMVTLCEAVQHAHAKLVVHADLKPSNVLVTADGQPHLVDFGIASMAQSLADATRTQAFPSTPAYASPERRKGAAPATADDVYALGLLLCGLLTGGWPDKPLDAPPVPSGVVPGIDADLDAIVAKACALAPADRYGSAEAMAADLRAFLDNRPVAARHGGADYVARRFAARHPKAVAASLLAVAAVIGGLAVTSALYVRAEHQRALAQARYDDVRALAGFMLGDAYDGMDRLAGAAALKARSTDVARTYLDKLASSSNATPDIEKQVAVGLARVGHATAVNSTNASGDMATGDRALAESEARLRALLKAAPGDDDLQAELARTLTWRSSLLIGFHNDPKGAQSALDEALRLWDGVTARHPDNLDYAYARMNTILGMGDVKASTEDLDGIVTLMTAEEARLMNLAATGDYVGQKALMIAAMENLLGDATYYSQSPEAGVAHYRRAVDTLEAARTEGLHDVRIPLRLALYYNQVASSYQDMKRPRDGLIWADKAENLADEVARYDDSVLAGRVVEIVSLERATLLSDSGDHRGALAEGARNVARREADMRADPDNAERRINLASAMRSYAEYHVAAGDHAGACRTAQRSKALFDEVAKQGGVPERNQRLDLVPLTMLLGTCA